MRAQGARGDPSSAAPPPGRGARARAARRAAGGRRGVGHERPARGVAVDVLAAQDVRGELMLEAAEEAPELRFRAHELRAAGHEELEGVAQRLRAAGQRQLRSRVHHLLLQRLQPGGPSFRSVAAAPGGPGPAPPPLHAASHRRPLGTARRPPPAPRLRGRRWPLLAPPAPAPLATFFSPRRPSPSGRRTRWMSCRPAQDGDGGRPPRGFVIGRRPPPPRASLSSPLSPPFALRLSFSGPAPVPAHRGPGSSHWVLSGGGAGTRGGVGDGDGPGRPVNHWVGWLGWKVGSMSSMLGGGRGGCAALGWAGEIYQAE